MQYRPEIDGLRALAVIPVILFHAGFSFFNGGFVGVDVFFVISGYLITSIIHEEQVKGRFSIGQFYERRARRILPALFLVMGVSSFFAYHWMLPDELENFGQSVVATVFFSNNMLLLLTAGYWDLASEFKPLLHTWSLGVEEQYYIVFPLLLMLTWRWCRGKTLHILVALAVVSLITAQWMSVHHPQAGFYMLPTRAWELLLGSIAALHLRTSQESLPPKHANWLSSVGVGMIVVSILSFDAKTPNPSIHMLLPTLGAFLIVLHATPGTFAHAVLASKPLVKIGLISYSAYLWHFPLFAFARIYAVNPPGVGESLLLCVATMILAHLTWRFVERPFRQKERFKQTQVFLLAGIMSAFFAAGGLILHHRHGFPERLHASSSGTGAGSHISYNESAFRFKNEKFPEQEGIRILVIGNSFGRDFVNMLLETFPKERMNIVYRDDISDCLNRVPTSLQGSLVDKADVVVLASGIASHACIDANIARMTGQGKQIYYLGTKHFGYNMNWLVRLGPEERKNQRNPLMAKTLEEEGLLARAVPPSHFVSLLDAIAKDNTVPITDEHGQLLSPDRTHLTRQGAIALGRLAIEPSALGRFIAHHRPTQPSLRINAAASLP